jgi:hypothetical protein
MATRHGTRHDEMLGRAQSEQCRADPQHLERYSLGALQRSDDPVHRALDLVPVHVAQTFRAGRRVLDTGAGSLMR